MSWEDPPEHLGARGDTVGPFCLPFSRKTGFWEMCWPLVGLLSFLVGRIQMDHFWEDSRIYFQHPISLGTALNFRDKKDALKITNSVLSVHLSRKSEQDT